MNHIINLKSGLFGRNAYEIWLGENNYEDHLSNISSLSSLYSKYFHVLFITHNMDVFFKQNKTKQK